MASTETLSQNRKNKKNKLKKDNDKLKKKHLTLSNCLWNKISLHSGTIPETLSDLLLLSAKLAETVVK